MSSPIVLGRNSAAAISNTNIMGSSLAKALSPTPTSPPQTTRSGGGGASNMLNDSISDAGSSASSNSSAPHSGSHTPSSSAGSVNGGFGVQWNQEVYKSVYCDKGKCDIYVFMCIIGFSGLLRRHHTHRRSSGRTMGSTRLVRTTQRLLVCFCT